VFALCLTVLLSLTLQVAEALTVKAIVALLHLASSMLNVTK